jgi:D-glycero-D-manno-heptose 1,7-bisphosphate phosphatase
VNAPRHPALFLDRDGVVNVEKNYVHRIEDFEFVPGIFELCTTAVERGFRPVVVTNQAGIGRGYYTEADFQALTAWMLERFRERGIDIAGVYHCPYHPTAGLGPYRRESFDRKPNPGMLLKACNDLRLDLWRSAFVGDKDSDMAAGRAAGVGQLIRLDPLAPGAQTLGDVTVVPSLLDAAAYLRQAVEQGR